MKQASCTQEPHSPQSWIFSEMFRIVSANREESLLSPQEGEIRTFTEYCQSMEKDRSGWIGILHPCILASLFHTN